MRSVAKGSDANPQWPTPNLSAVQKAGSRSESYEVTFDASGKTYRYSPNDAQEYAQFTTGSKWTLKVNGLGDVTFGHAGEVITPVMGNRAGSHIETRSPARLQTSLQSSRRCKRAQARSHLHTPCKATLMCFSTFRFT